MKFVRLTDNEGCPIAINLDLIYRIRRVGTGQTTELLATTGGVVYARETLEEILALAGVPPALPAECAEKGCHYQDYLARGDDELTHDGFHAAERLSADHMANCSHDWTKGSCPICIDHEQRIRA